MSNSFSVTSTHVTVAHDERHTTVENTAPRFSRAFLIWCAELSRALRASAIYDDERARTRGSSTSACQAADAVRERCYRKMPE